MRIIPLLLLSLPGSTHLLPAQTQSPTYDFETGEPGEIPGGWFIPPVLQRAGYTALITKEGCFQGSSCAVLGVPAKRPPNTFGNLMASTLAMAHRGKRVAFRAAVRVQGDGNAALWLRVDRPNRQMGFFDNMSDPPIRSAEWKFYEIRGAIDADALTLNYGVMVQGDAKAWVDSVSLDITDPPAPGPEVSAAQAEIAKRYAQLDAAYSRKDLEAIRAILHPDVKIGFPMRQLSLKEALEALNSQFAKNQQYEIKTEIASLEAQGPTEASVRIRAVATIFSSGETDKMESTSADRWVKGDDGNWRLKESLVMSNRRLLAPTSPEETKAVAAQLKQQATPLVTVEAGHSFEDLEGFGKAVGDARVVALGEATHGTREIFKMKHRLLEYLVKEKGFTVFAIEANWPESQAADRYIKTGEGDPKAALAAMYFWTWQTEEVLAMLEWMRAYNQSAAPRKLSFTSFDMQTFTVARDRVVEFLTQHAPDDVGFAEKAYAYLSRIDRRQRSDPAARQAYEQAETVVALLDKRRDRLIANSSPTEFRDSVQAARIVVQAAKRRAPATSGDYRDEMMARNFEWLMRDAYPNEKIVLWAHNGHISRTGWMGFPTMGNWLSQRIAPGDIYIVGFAIHEGHVRAVTSEGGRMIGLAASAIPPAAAGTGTATLSAANMPRFFLDLRQQQPGELERWLSEPHLFRTCGSSWYRDNPEAAFFLRCSASPTTD